MNPVIINLVITGCARKVRNYLILIYDEQRNKIYFGDHPVCTKRVELYGMHPIARLLMIISPVLINTTSIDGIPSFIMSAKKVCELL